jgi:hypothetical protein
VLIDRKIDGLHAHFVGMAHIGGPEISTAAGRVQGYREVVARRRMSPDRVIVGERGR